MSEQTSTYKTTKDGVTYNSTQTVTRNGNTTVIRVVDTDSSGKVINDKEYISGGGGTKSVKINKKDGKDYKLTRGNYTDSSGKILKDVPLYQVTTPTTTTTQSDNYGVFKDSKGNLFSANPDLVVKDVRQRPFQNPQITYYSGRIEEKKNTGVLYGNLFEMTETKKVSSPKSNFFTPIVKAKNDVQTGISDVLFPYNPKTGERNLNPGREFDMLYKDKSNSKTFYDVPVVGSISKETTNILMDKPLDTAITYGVFKGTGKLVSLSPATVSFLSKPAVSKTLTTGYLGSSAVSIATSKDGYAKASANAIVDFAVSSKGFDSGLKSFKGFELKNVEAVKSISEVRSSDKNLGFFNEKGFNVASSQSKSQGGGLFQQGNKYYKLTFEETGKGIDLNENSKAVLGTAKIKIQEFKYLRNPRTEAFVKSSNELLGTKYVEPKGTGIKINAGRPRTAIMQTSGRITKIGNNEQLDLISKIKTRDGSFFRVTSGTINNKGDTSFFKGESIDTTNKKIIPNSKKVLFGKSETILSSTESNIYGDVITKTSSKNINLGLGKEEIKNDIRLDIKNIKGEYAKNSYIESSNNLLGVSNSLKTNTGTITATIPINSLTTPKTKLSTLESPKTIPKLNINVVESSNNLETPKLNTKIYGRLTTSRSRSNNILSSTTSQVLDYGVSTRQRSGLRLNNMLKQNQTTSQKQLLGNIPIQFQERSQRVAQRTAQRQITIFGNRYASFSRMRLSNPTRSNFSITGLNQSRKVDKLFNSKPSGLFKGSFKSKYEPSITAAIFNIKSKKINMKSARTGLTIRPLKI